MYYQTKPISPKGILKLICVSHSLHHLKGQLLLYPAPWAQAASTCWELQPGQARKTSSPGRWHWKGGCLSILSEKVRLNAHPDCLAEFLLLLVQCRTCYKEKKTAPLPSSCSPSSGTQPLLQAALRTEARTVSPLSVAWALLGKWAATHETHETKPVSVIWL